ncbi:hypothetical protein [Georgenia sp. AZ-5]|uniref:hypothetical protein n=1 Tax=Georgenia sp. AZ-5 TaxID=3367526 RepID=UPI00375438E2
MAVSSAPREPTWADPWPVSPVRAELFAALATLARARQELLAAFPERWRGAGATAYGEALAALLHHAQVLAEELREAERAAGVADQDRAAMLGTAGHGA